MNKLLVILGGHGRIYHATYPYGLHVSYLCLPSPYGSLLFSFKYLVYNQTQADIFLTDYAELNPKIIRHIVNKGIKGYSQLVDINLKKNTWL